MWVHFTDLAKLEKLTVATEGLFTAGTYDFVAINTVNLSGTGAVTLDDLGKNDLAYNLTVNASGLAGDTTNDGLTIGNIFVGEGKTIALNVAGVTGDVTLNTGATVTSAAGSVLTGAINVNANGTMGEVALGALTAKTVTVNAGNALKTVGATVVAETATLTGGLGVSTFDVTASKTATVTGGIAADVFTLTGAAATGAKATFTVTTGLGEDAITITAGVGSTVVTVTDFTVGTDEAIDGLTASAVVTSIAENGAAYLNSFLGGTSVTEAKVVYVAAGILEYAGSTYIIESADAVFGNADVVVKLTGVTGATAAELVA